VATRQIKELFNGRYFDIPKYQRGFAWEKKNVRELFDDIYESLETDSNHYIGTIVLSRNPEKTDFYYIVDGQQRITTITLIINAIIHHLPKKDAEYYRRFYIKEDRYRLKPLGKDKDYFLSLLSQKREKAENKSQRLLLEAYEEIKTVIAREKNKGRLLKAIEKLEMMEFTESSEGDAIRIFQTVNDRGKPLSNMEKAKSLLVYFSNRYLDKKLDDTINDIFGEIFEIYDDIKTLGEKLEINLISNKEFNEDNLMRYHFVMFSEDNYDATAAYVLDFLKARLSQFRNDGRKSTFADLQFFIDTYINSLHQFFLALRKIVTRATKKAKYFRLFNILGLSATLYPLITKLEMLGFLESKLEGKDFAKYTFIDLIELIDVRVYKTKGTDPKAEISRFAYQLDDSWKIKDIQDWLLEYNKSKMPKESFLSFLRADIYGNRALPHIFIDYSENIDGSKLSYKDLLRFSKTRPTIEHIIAQAPKFAPRTLGFKNLEDFIEYNDKIGNLTVLEEKINKAVQNKNPSEKVTSYDRSGFSITTGLSSKIAKQKQFTKTDIQQRSEELTTFCVERWWC
jgi:hypothetical protein